MTSILHQFLQSISAVVFLAFILQVCFISQSTLYLKFIGYIHSFTPLAYVLLINKFAAILLIFILTLLVFLKSVIFSPSYLKNISAFVYFCLGFALLGFVKLTLGELNPFTLGFIEKEGTIIGEDVAFDHNLIRIRDYSTMYGAPNGYFYYFILLVNLIGVRAFSQVKKTGDPIDTKLPSRAEIKESQVVGRKRRRSIDEHDLTETRRKSVDLMDSGQDLKQPLGTFDSIDANPIESTRKFELFEKEFSVQSPENLSQADSDTTNVKSSSSMVFLEKFEKLRKPSSIISILLRLKDNSLGINRKEPKLVIFWLMTYQNFRRLTGLLLTYVGLSLLLSGNTFTSDLVFAFLIAKVFSRFYFRVLER